MPTECYPTGKRVTPQEVVEAAQSKYHHGGKYLPAENPEHIGFWLGAVRDKVQLCYYWLYAAESPQAVVLLHGRDWPEKKPECGIVEPIVVPKGTDGLIGLEEFVKSGKLPKQAYYLAHQVPHHICYLLIHLGILTPQDLRMVPQGGRIC